VIKPPIRVFCGYDPRERHGFHAFIQSLIDHASVEVAIIPLCGEQRDGTNTFIYERFLVPYHCGFKGSAIFLDGSDMLMRADIVELAALQDPDKAVQVVRHNYKTTSPRKYIGTSMEADNQDYPRKNWSSVVIWNCEHPRNKILTPEYVAKATGSHLHRFEWLDESLIGGLPSWWNVLIGEFDQPRTNIALCERAFRGRIPRSHAQNRGTRCLSDLVKDYGGLVSLFVSGIGAVVMKWLLPGMLSDLKSSAAAAAAETRAYREEANHWRRDVDEKFKELGGKVDVLATDVAELRGALGVKRLSV
jgi:hypothetical protein